MQHSQVHSMALAQQLFFFYQKDKSFNEKDLFL